LRSIAFVILAVVLAGIAGAAAAVTVARRGFVQELHDALPAAQWIGDPVFSEGLYPRLVVQAFAGVSHEEAAASLSELWVMAGATRTNSITAFRRGGRTLYLEDGEPARVELVANDPCSALASPIPLPAPDGWLQFGATPAVALQRVGHLLEDLQLDPCPGSGYWVQSPTNGGVVFRFGTTPSYLSLDRLQVVESGRPARLAPGLGTGEILETPRGPVLQWQEQVRYTYDSGAETSEERTACMTLWPKWLCMTLSR
jgi:hypothetical protein